MTLTLVTASALCGRARAEGPLVEDTAFRVRPQGRFTADAGLRFGLPTTLDTGLSSGVGGGVSFGRTFALGIRASWSSSSESSLAWGVSHQDFRLRGAFAVQHAIGRGTLALRLGLGPTFVYEDRARNQGARAGLTGSALETTTRATIPAGELEGVVVVHIAGPWLLIMSGGPSLALADGVLHGGWTTLVGAGWQP